MLFYSSTKQSSFLPKTKTRTKDVKLSYSILPDKPKQELKRSSSIILPINLQNETKMKSTNKINNEDGKYGESAQSTDKNPNKGVVVPGTEEIYLFETSGNKAVTASLTSA